MNRVLYREWFPQIVYNHHQTGPAGTVMFAPPFRDPFNYNLRPAGPARHRRRRRGDAQPVHRRGQARRDHAQRVDVLDLVERRPAHDVVLPQHDRHPDRDHRQPDADHRPVRAGASRSATRDLLVSDRAAGEWHFRQSIEYSITANRAMLDYASRYRESLPLQHLPDGQGRDRAGQPGSLDVHAAQDRADAQALGIDRGRRAAAGVAAVAARPTPGCALSRR